MIKRERKVLAWILTFFLTLVSGIGNTWGFGMAEEMPIQSEIAEEIGMPEITPQETAVPPETTIPETTLPETTIPETTPQETAVPPETAIPETTPSETTIPETTPQETAVPPETAIPETTIPETTPPETTVPETSPQETAVPPETTVPETTPEENSSEETAEEGTTEEESTEEESSEEESSEEESSEEIIPEDDIEFLINLPMPLELGDVTQIMEITSCKIEGTNVVVQGRMNAPFTTWNKEFYLFEGEMCDSEPNKDPIAVTDQAETFSFTVPLNEGTKDSKLYSRFFVGVRFRNGEYYPISEGHYITNPEVLAGNQSAFPQAKSKKGLFVETFWGTDMDELGISYANINIVINELFKDGDFSYTYNGKTYYYSAGYIAYLDRILQTLQHNNIITNAILLVRPGGGTADFAYPGIDQSIGSYHGWNVVTSEGIDCVSATIHFLGERYGRADNAYGHIANWIVGNEVNADTAWNYTGHPSVVKYCREYTDTLRVVYQAVKSSCAHARIYMPLDMFWNNSSSSSRYDGKQMVDMVNTYMKAEGDIAWGIAFHPYANPLTEPEWWNDHADMSENAGFISMQNLSVLTNYLQKSGLRDPDGGVKKVILSEEGYTSYSDNQGNVEWKQAAAYAYAYYMVEANPYIQCMAVMRQKDADLETKDGLHQGMWYDNQEKDFYTFGKKPVWTVWKYIDTAQSFEYTDSLASIVGLSSFSGIYGAVMASKNWSIVSGKAGYASSFTGSTPFTGSWQPEYMVNGISSSNGAITVNAGQNSPFTYSSIVWNGTVNLSEQSVFGFRFQGTAGESQNLRVRMRFSSGENIYEAETSVKKDTSQLVYTDLSGWAGRSSITQIQIWVQQDGMELWNNGSFTVSDFCIASQAVTEDPTVVVINEAYASNVTGNGFDIVSKVSGNNGVERVEYSAWHIKSGTSTAVTKTGTVTDGMSSVHFDISSFNGQTGAYKVRIVAYNKDGIASKEVMVSVDVNGVKEGLVVLNVYTSAATQTGFTITVEARSDYGLSSNSTVAVWSEEGGQDDLVWYPLNFVNGAATVNVSTAMHKYSSGEYHCHAYVRDNAGNQKLFAATATVPTILPIIVSAKVSNVTSAGYLVTCTFSCYYKVAQVAMPTWTEANDQDDIVWHNASISGNTASFYVKTSDHNNESGVYITHIYVYDAFGRSALTGLKINVPEDLAPENLNPVIVSLEAKNVTENGYQIVCQYKVPVGLSEISMPTWTEKNGQDDKIAYQPIITGNGASVYVPITSHNNESGNYITEVQIKDFAGNTVSKRITVKVPEPSKPEITEIKTSDVTALGYRVTVIFKTLGTIKEVVMPTWTTKNGQDDLVWHQAEVSGNTASFYVSVSDHNGESGTYCTHVYVRQTNGKEALAGINVNVPERKLVIKNAKTSEVSSAGYRVTVEFEATAGVKEVQMPTWSNRNGQDDLVWHQAEVNGSTATFYVPTSLHKGDTGSYTTHVYVYDKTDKKVICGVSVIVPGDKLQITDLKASDIGSSGYRITAEFDAPAGVKEVLMPTWSNKNGQDDVVWHKAEVNGSTATFYVPISLHKGDTGEYTTHVYVYDKEGKKVIAGITVKVPDAELQIIDVKITELSSAGYRVTAEFEAPAGVKEVLMPTWSNKNGQDDVVWHVAEINGNTATFYVPVSLHKGDIGEYTTHIYVYDRENKYVIRGVTVTVPSGKLQIISIKASEISKSGYRVTAEFEAPAGVKEVLMPSWSSKNGQDDVVWHKAVVSQNTATCYISASQHNGDTGEYITHVYVYDNAGKQVLDGISVNVK